MSMNVLVFQHTPVESPGSLLDWLHTRHHQSLVHHWYRDSHAPDAEEFDWLIILGGTMGVDEEKEHPWLKEEKAFLRDWLQAEKPVLGICLGGQLLAQALGGKVTKNPQREIGFHEVSKVGPAHPFLRQWPQTTRVYQFHEDTFTLPPGCQNLMSSPACPNQAFAREDDILGLQFHPESTREWILSNASSVKKKENEPYVQNPTETAAAVRELLAPMTTNFFRLLDSFSKGIH
jgi:GMP synthase-like glutamine amidotransferase